MPCTILDLFNEMRSRVFGSLKKYYKKFSAEAIAQNPH
jgi:hypothetical protein